MHEIELKTYPKPLVKNSTYMALLFSPYIKYKSSPKKKKTDNYDWGSRLLIEIQMETERTTLVAN